MADFISCINDALNGGAISKETADRVLSSSDPESELNSAVLEMTLKKREVAADSVAISSLIQDIEGFEGKHGIVAGIGRLFGRDLPEFDYAEALKGAISRSETSSAINVEKLGDHISQKFYARNAELLQELHPRVGPRSGKQGFFLSQDVDRQRNLVRALAGEKIDDPALDKYAKSLLDTFEELRVMFNKSGGSIPKRSDWFLPQSHNPRAITKSSFGTENYFKDRDLWKQDTVRGLNKRRMTDDTGRVLTDSELDEALDFVFESITTGGLNKSAGKPIPPWLEKKLSRRHSEHRFLVFKDADSWLDYNDRYGSSDILSTITGHIETLSRDIAMLRRFGPNHEQNYKAARSLAKSKGAPVEGLAHADVMFSVASGRTTQGELKGLADISQTTTNVVSGAILGGAFISAMSDIFFGVMKSVYRKQNFIAPIFRQMSLMTSEEKRLFAAKIGIVSDIYTGRVNATNRWADVYGTGASANVSEAVMRGSLLSTWTSSGRSSHAMQDAINLAERFSKGWEELEPHFLEYFKEYGIEKADWDKFRKSQTSSYKGVEYADFTQEGAEKFHMASMSEQDIAVPTADYRVRGITTGGLERASITGQAWRIPMMLKSFPIGVMTTHFARMAHQSTLRGKLQYGAALFAGTTIMGGLALQLKDIAAGREPRNMDSDGNHLIDKKFIAAAALQGGGLSIFGDFAFSDQNRFGGGLASTIAGPKVDLADRVIMDFGVGNIQELLAGEETNAAGEAVDLLGRYQPKIWQTRLFQDAVADQMEILVDDDAQSRFERRIRNRERDFDQEYWWKPGEILPEALQ